MKTLVIVLLALAALVCADDQEFSMKTRMEKFQEKKNEMREKWNSMTEEERQKIRETHHDKMPIRPIHQFKDIPEDVRQKMKEKFESLSPEKRQIIHDRFQRRFPDGAMAYNTQGDMKNADHIRSQINKMSDEDKQKIREKIEKLTPEQREEIRNLRRDQRLPAISGPVPAAADGNFQKIRTREEDIMIKTRDGPSDRRRPRFPELPQPRL